MRKKTTTSHFEIIIIFQFSSGLIFQSIEVGTPAPIPLEANAFEMMASKQLDIARAATGGGKKLIEKVATTTNL